MKALCLVAFLLFLSTMSFADQKAITDTGEKVILKSDGTWVSVDKAPTTGQNIETNKTKFQKPQGSTFLLKSTKNNSAFWVNPTKWSFKKVESGVGEYEFELKDEDVYAKAINERIAIPFETLPEMALINAREAAPNAKIVKQEYRVVNGKKVLCLEINGTLKGIDFTFFGYYYSSTAGITQLVTFTGTNLLNKYMSEIIDFLNGLDTY